MKIKSLLLGSAAASMLAVSGAQAADPIIYAEPEAMEYVRICDVYGAGYYYIPGTETCLRIGGYLRMELRHGGNRNAYGNVTATVPSGRMVQNTAANNAAAGSALAPYDPTIPTSATNVEMIPDGAVIANPALARTYGSFMRAAPTWDARSETEWGTLRGFIEAHFDYTSAARASRSVPGTLAAGTNSAYINQAFIELGGLRMGKTDNLYSRALGYGAGGVFGASYGFSNDNEISYTFSNAGFTAGVALIENHDNNWAPDVQGIANYSFAPGSSLGGGFAYDNVNNQWAAKGVMRLAIPNMTGSSVGVHVFYASNGGAGAANRAGSNFNRYAVISPASGNVSQWSVLAHAFVRVDPTLALKGHVQWFQETAIADTWQVVGGLNWEPVSGLTVQPEIAYTTNSRKTDFTVRFQRSF